MKSNYDREPYIRVEGQGGRAWSGYAEIAEALSREIAVLGQEKAVVVVECYPGVCEDEVLAGLGLHMPFDSIVKTAELLKTDEELETMLAKNITDDRVFGLLSHHVLADFFDTAKLAAAGDRMEETADGLHLVIGVGASLVARGDILVYADLARWEIQQRFRAGALGNLGAKNAGADILRLYKRAFFIDWRVADRHKKTVFHSTDFFLDTNKANAPAMATGEAVRYGIAVTVARPFRVVPYFDAGVWGGQWMKERFDLPENGSNYAWGFDCVPEENSLILELGGIKMEFPAINMVLFWPNELLGARVHARFGTEFPIRFDLLDTMGGQNLSLQVHPLTEYIQEQFGMHYTQDESYYILDCKPDSHVYLGIRDGAVSAEMLTALTKAQEGAGFEEEQYVNKLPIQKHDHFSIPAGTVHCSGSDTMVLEISATPYIFTFKLWDWDRLGLDGLPRPVHLEHGAGNIQFDRRTAWVQEGCASPTVPITDGDGWREERTGLHSLEYIETRRRWFNKKTEHHTEGNLHVLNLVAGDEILVESPTGAFAPFAVHYAETFIVPAQVGAYTITPVGYTGQDYATVTAYVRF